MELLRKLGNKNQTPNDGRCDCQHAEKLIGSGQKRLEERVTGILKRLKTELDDADQKIDSKLHVLDIDNDGVISMNKYDRWQ